MHMEDPKKVQAKIDELIKSNGHKWVALNGAHAITKVDVKGDSDFVFYPSSGMPVKVFVDLLTGETRSFMWFVFEVDKK